MADELNENLENANKGINKLKDELKDALALQKQMEKSVGSYLSVIEKIGEAKRSIAKTEKQIAKEERRLAKQRSNLTDDQIAASKKLIAALRLQNKEAKEQVENLSKAAAEASKIKAIARSTAGFVYKWGFQNLRGWGVFEMDKEIRNATRSMALGGKGFSQLSRNLGSAANSTTMMGVNLKSLAKMQQGYSEAIGRSVMLTEAGNEAMAELAEGTGLGEGFAIEMAGAMDNFGASVETSRDLVEDTMNIAAEMGVNGAAATKSLQSALQKSQRFVFKGGVKALSRMANAATKLKLDMDGIAGVAENVFRPEGAIELAAKLNTIGGEFAKLGNPMKLMFKARNDFEGFAKDIGRASKEFVQFNQESGTFELKGGLAADRMREIANMTGISVEKLREMAVQQAKIEKIGTLLPLSVEDDDKELIESYARFKDGEAVITVGGQDKLIKDLTNKDLDRIREEKLTLKERAELNQTFADTLENSMTTLKQLFVPLAQALQEGLGKPLINFVNQMDKEMLFKKIQDFGTKLIDFGKYMGSWITWGTETFGAKGILATVFLGGAALWFSKGVSLGMGFNSVASVGGPGLMSKTAIATTRGKGLSGKMGKFGKSMARGGMLKGGALALGGLGANVARGYLDDPESGLGKGLGVLGDTASFAGTGAMIGSVIPGLGTAAGAVIGGLLGAGKGVYDEFINVNDGIVKFNPKDKFIGIGNDTIVAGTDAGGNRALANQIAGGSTGGKTEVIHKHENMKITFEFVGLSESTARDLLSNSRFIKDMNSRLNEVSSSVFSGGKLSPNPKFSN
jgi:hypothetical protein